MDIADYAADTSRYTGPLPSAEVNRLARILRSSRRPAAAKAAARERLITSHMRLALGLAASKRASWRVPSGDLASVAMMALIRAVDSYDHRQGSLSAWVHRRVSWALADHYRAAARWDRIQTDAQQPDTTTEPTSPLDRATSPVAATDAAADQRDLVGRLDAAVRQLPPLQGAVIRLRFGLGLVANAALT